jgi:hypothetical protein
MDSMAQLLDADVLAVLIPILAIIGFFSLRGVNAYFKHTERMEKIRNGIDPDAVSENSKNK